jgi:hypothetical protein
MSYLPGVSNLHPLCQRIVTGFAGPMRRSGINRPKQKKCSGLAALNEPDRWAFNALVVEEAQHECQSEDELNSSS